MQMEGPVVSWTVPVRGTDGFTSTIDVADKDGFSCVLHVTTHTLEEHVWLTRVGQWVRASDVEWDSLCEGRTRFCWVPGDGEAGGCRTRYEDVPVDKIAGFQHEEGNVLSVFFEKGAQVKSVDSEKSKQLLDIGIGGYVLLYNVKVTQRGVFVTSGSGVRKMEREPDPVAPLTPPPLLGPLQKPEKWYCVVCLYLNFVSKSVCHGCDLQRKQGPLPKHTWDYRFDSVEPYVFKRFPQWMCDRCRHRDNFYFHDICVKCGDTRKEKKTKSKKRKKNIPTV
jgi:hypothetical protein